MMMTPPLPRAFCDNLEDKGVISNTQTRLSFSGDTSEASLRHAFDLPCGGGGEVQEQGFKFTADGDMVVDLELSEPGTFVRWAMEVYRGSCEAPIRLNDNGTDCTAQINRSARLFVPDGETVFVAAEPRMPGQTGTFEIEAAITEIVCRPPGSRVCGDAAQVRVCESGGASETLYQCVESTCLEERSECLADSCQGAKVYTRDELLAGAQNFSGGAGGYRDTITLAAPSTCKNPDTETIPADPSDPDANPNPPPPGEPFQGISTPGQDVTFQLMGLRQGDLLSVRETSPQIDAAIAVSRTCDLNTCLIALDIGDGLEGWAVPEDGDYVVIVDRRNFGAADIAITLGLELPTP